ncbi:MAG: hypothetical protein U0869_07805 [Chloroflexota bacterium]
MAVTKSMRGGRLVAALVLTAGGLASGSVPATAQATAQWAWATVRNGTGDSLVSVATDAGSVSGGGAGVHRVGTGHYQVTFYGAQKNGSITSVAVASPIGTTARTCATGTWMRSTDSEVVEVFCQTLDGVAMDSGFVVHWLAAQGTGGVLGYGWNGSPTDNCGGPGESYSSVGGSNQTCPVNGNAETRFGSLGVDGGVAIVGAKDQIAFQAGSFPTSCSLVSLTTVLNPHNVGNPSDDTTDKFADVRCWETNDTNNIYHEHVVVFMKGLGLKGTVRKTVAYLVARRPTAASYHPAQLDRYTSSGGAITVKRLGTGHYAVTLDRMPKGGGAQVTVLDGSERRVCTIAGITTRAVPPTIRVSCFDGAGVATDTRFVLAYTR